MSVQSCLVIVSVFWWGVAALLAYCAMGIHELLAKSVVSPSGQLYIYGGLMMVVMGTAMFIGAATQDALVNKMGWAGPMIGRRKEWPRAVKRCAIILSGVVLSAIHAALALGFSCILAHGVLGSDHLLAFWGGTATICVHAIFTGTSWREITRRVGPAVRSSPEQLHSPPLHARSIAPAVELKLWQRVLMVATLCVFTMMVFPLMGFKCGQIVLQVSVPWISCEMLSFLGITAYLTLIVVGAEFDNHHSQSKH